MEPILDVEATGLDGANATGSWELFDLSSRMYASVAVLPRGDVVVVGGSVITEQESDLDLPILASKNGGLTWSVATAHTAMPHRDGAFLFAPSNGSLVVAAGLGNMGLLRDVWRSDDVGATWAQVSAQPPWQARGYGGAARLPGDELILAGGGMIIGGEVFNDVWASRDAGATWEQRTAHAGWEARSTFGMAAARCSASGAATSATSRLIVAGGWSEAHPVGSNDVWVSDDSGATWQLATAAAAWSTRSAFAMAVVPGASGDTVVIMGGMGTHLSLDGLADVWAANACSPGHWWNVTHSPPWLPRRACAGGVLLDGTLLLFGGATKGGGNLGSSDVSLAPVWRSGDGGSTWNTAFQPDPWSPRGGARMVTTLSGAVLLLGGEVAGKGIRKHVAGADDSWTSRNVGLEWHHAQHGGSAWSPRAWQAVAVHPEGLVLLMGGSVNAYMGPFFNDVWASADEGSTWELRSASAGWRPRNNAASVVLPNGRVLLLGGWGEGYMYCGDVWYSDDAGFTWNPLPLPNGDIQFCNSTVGRWEHGRKDLGLAMLPATPPVPSGEGMTAQTQAEVCGVTLVVAGGVGVGADSTGGVHNDVWWSQDCGRAWVRVVAHAEWEPRYSFGLLPLPRINATTLLLFGGAHPLEGIHPYNDVWRSGDAGITWELLLESAPWSDRRGMAFSLVEGGSPMLAGGFTHNGGAQSASDTWVGTADGSMWRKADVGVRSWADADAGAITPGLVVVASGRDAVSQQPQTSYQLVSIASATPLAGWQGSGKAMQPDEPILFQRAAARVPLAAMHILPPTTPEIPRFVAGAPAYGLVLIGGAAYGSLQPRSHVDVIVPVCRRKGCALQPGGPASEDEVEGFQLSADGVGGWTPRRAAMAAAATYTAATVTGATGSYPVSVSVLLLLGGRDAEGRALSDLWASLDGGMRWQPVAGPGPQFPDPAPWGPISRGVLLAAPSCGAFCFALATGEGSSGRLRRTLWRLRLAPVQSGTFPANGTVPPWSTVRLAATQLVYNASTLPYLPRHSASPVTMPGGSGGCFVGGQEETGARVGDVWCTWDGAKWWQAGPSPPTPPSPISYGAGTTAVDVPSVQGAVLLGGAQRSLLAHVPTWSVAEPLVGQPLVRGAFHALRYRAGPLALFPDLAVRLRCVVERNTGGPGLRGWVPGPAVIATADADANGWSGGATLPAGAAPPGLAHCASQHAMWSLEVPSAGGGTSVKAASAPLPLSDDVALSIAAEDGGETLVAGMGATLSIRRRAGVMAAADVWLTPLQALRGPSWRHLQHTQLLAAAMPLPAPGAAAQKHSLLIPPDTAAGLFAVRVVPAWEGTMPGPLPSLASRATFVRCPRGYAPGGKINWAGEEVCRPCAVGMHSEGFNCMPCPAGTHGIEVNGTASCTPCPVGTYRPSYSHSGDSSSSSSSSGGSSSGDDKDTALVCDPCPVGMYGVRSGGVSQQDACAPCPAGTIGSTPAAAGRNACALCPTGTYSGSTGESSLTACTSCPRGRTTLGAGATSASACWCARGSYRRGGFNASCIECKEEAPFQCGELNLTAATLPLKPGYWVPASAEVWEGQQPAACPHPHACVGGRPGALCATGHRGVLCEACTADPPYGRPSLVTAVLDRPCQPCTAASRRAEWVSAIAGMLFFVAASVVVHMPRVTRAVLRGREHTLGPVVAASWRALQLTAVVWEASGVMRPPQSNFGASVASWLQLLLGDPAAATQWGCIAGRGLGRFVVGTVFASLWLAAAAATVAPRVWIAATAHTCPQALRTTAGASKLVVDGLFVVALRPSLAMLLPSRVPTWRGEPGPAEPDWTTLANVPGAAPSDVPPTLEGIAASLVAATMAFVVWESVQYARQWRRNRLPTTASRVASVSRHVARLQSWAAPRTRTSVSSVSLLGAASHHRTSSEGMEKASGAPPPFPDSPSGRRLHDAVLVLAAMCTAGLRREASSLVPALLCLWTLSWLAATLQVRSAAEPSMSAAERASSVFVHLAVGVATVATAG